MSRQLSQECVLSDVFPYTVHMLCCQILNTISWKHDKTKPN